MPNGLAYLALLAWPLVAAGLFATLTPARALVWTLLGGYLLLPPVAAFDAPLVPPLDKFSIATLSALAGCLATAGGGFRLLPRSIPARLLVVAFVAGPILTVLTNPDPLVFPMAVVPGLGPHDTLSALVGQSIEILPFLLARHVLATEAARRDVLAALVLAGVVYSLPMLVEIRLSPQINVWVYGFFAHDFIQMMRYGGYRPMVFLPHGLWAAFFVTMAFLSAVALWRHGPAARRMASLAAAGWLAVLLVLCKSMAALVYGVLLAPVVAFGSRSLQLRLAAVLALVAVSYPLLRGAELVPVDALVASVEAVDAERAASLRFRFMNEDALLARATERPVFGWGGWGRHVIRDPVSGGEISVNDGRWIIVIGSHGWFGFIAEFGLLALAPVLLALRCGRGGASALAGPLALILGANMIDMLPNATIIPFTWLIAGALLGHAEALAGAPSRPLPAPGPAPEAKAPRPRTLL